MTIIPNRNRVIIEKLLPEIDCGRFPAKRVVDDLVTITGHIFADGHDEISAVLLHKKEGVEEWEKTPFTLLYNDEWHAAFQMIEMGTYVYTAKAWIDPFKTWRRDLKKKADAEVDTDVDYQIGLRLVQETALRTLDDKVKAKLIRFAERLEKEKSQPLRLEIALDEELARLIQSHPDVRQAVAYPRQLSITVDRPKARFSAWYEMFPRSASPEPGRHGTFLDVEARLPYVAEMGFDVLYLPPIHPIGATKRKGKNNRIQATPDEPGSPWAIGAKEGGHKAIHPELGTPEDFRRLVKAAKEHGLEIAMDIAFQTAPDHPYVKAHPEWFLHRPDGSIQYAENPPKKYEDIYPFYFDGPAQDALWEELKSIFDHWIAQGVAIFRVDNPHTKPLAFWEWAIGEIKKSHPEVIFLAEAFTRPKIKYRLAKLGFTQSYNYFPWRNNKQEIIDYFTELTKTEVNEFFRPNLWTNTPDILTEYLQTGGRPAFVIRLILAATLGASYGIYGPPFELAVNVPRNAGSEEYLDSEKYEIHPWNLDAPHSLRKIISRVNRIRRENPALQRNETLRFHQADNEYILCYSKTHEETGNLIIVTVNLDPHHAQAGWITLPLDELGIDSYAAYQVHDLLGEARYIWNGPKNYVELNPHVLPAHIFTVRRRIRQEMDFDYF